MVTFDVSSSSGDMQCLEIMVVGDSDYESDETVTFGLTVTRTGQAGSMNSATLTIMNDDEGKSRKILRKIIIIILLVHYT